MNLGKQFKDGMLTQNPVLVQVLGMCSTMAITTSFFNGIGMGVAVTIILTLSNIIISAMRKIIPDKIRIAMFIVVIAGFVTCVDLLIQAFVPALSESLGVLPYALSKIQAEQYLQEWCNKHHVTLGIIRPSLIAGPNPPGNLGAMINGIRNGKYFSIAGGRARKSVLMVQDIANLIPLLAEQGGIYNVCDTYQPTFRELESVICRQLGKSMPLSIPYWLAKSMAVVGDCLGSKAPINSLKLNKITKSLTFSNEKAMRELGWKPMNVLENFKIE